MSLRQNKNYGSRVGGTSTPKPVKKTKRVADIILNPNHPKYTGPDSIGIIFFSDENSQEIAADVYSLPIAKPISRNNFTAPLIGEVVEVIQSISGDYYKDLGGRRNNKSYYYYPPLNIHNNTTNNALPVQIQGPRSTTNPTGVSFNDSNFSLKTEFTNISLQAVERDLDNYLRDLGYSSGRKDQRAPKYKLSKLDNGRYSFILSNPDDGSSLRLGDYFEENNNQQPLTPTEGDQIYEGRLGQRIRFTSTGPDGINSISDGATQVEDGNSTIGDPAILLSLGEDSLENINTDQGSFYILSNHKISIDVICKNVDSLNATYTELVNPLTQIAAPAPIVLPEEPISTTPDIDYNNLDPVDDTHISLPLTTPTPQIDDPLFDDLNQTQDESIL